MGLVVYDDDVSLFTKELNSTQDGQNILNVNFFDADLH